MNPMDIFIQTLGKAEAKNMVSPAALNVLKTIGNNSLRGRLTELTVSSKDLNQKGRDEVQNFLNHLHKYYPGTIQTHDDGSCLVFIPVDADVQVAILHKDKVKEGEETRSFGFPVVRAHRWVHEYQHKLISSSMTPTLWDANLTKHRGFSASWNKHFAINPLIKRVKKDVLKQAMKSLEKLAKELKDNTFARLIEVDFNTLVKEGIDCIGSFLDGRGRNYWLFNLVVDPINNKWVRAFTELPEDIAPATTKKLLDVVAWTASTRSGKKQFRSAKARLEYGYTLLKEGIENPSTPDEWSLYLDHMRYMDYLKNPDTHRWTGLVELDMSASVCMILACILHNRKMLKKLNVIRSLIDAVNDGWTNICSDVPRQVAKFCTQVLYGVENMWNAMVNDFEDISKEDLKRYHNILKEVFLKEFRNLWDYKSIFRKAKVNHKLTLNWRGETFTTKYTKPVRTPKAELEEGESDPHMQYQTVQGFKATNSGVIIQSPRKIPVGFDFEINRMRKYFPSMIAHSEDSRIASHVCEFSAAKGFPCLTIHDAYLISPALGYEVNELVINHLKELISDGPKALINLGAQLGIESEVRDLLRKGDTIKLEELDNALPLK